MLVSKSVVAAGASVSHNPTSLTQSFISANLATSFFNVRKGVGRGDYFRKGVCIPLSSPSETQPLAIARVGCH